MQRIPFAIRIIAGIFLLLLFVLVIWSDLFGIFSGKDDPSTLVYLDQPGSQNESLVEYHQDGSKITLLSDFGTLLEYRPSPNGRWLALITQKDGMMQVHQYDVKNRKYSLAYDCGDAACSALSWAADSTGIYFSVAQGTPVTAHEILSVDIGSDEITSLTFKAGLQPAYFSQSADGHYQVVYDTVQKGYYVLENWQKELVLVLSQDPAPVLWLDNPQRVVMVATENRIQIPVSKIAEVDLSTLQIRYVQDKATANMDYNNLIEQPQDHSLVFGCRPVLRTMSRQICTANQTEFIVTSVTDAQNRNHAGLVFSTDGAWLAYQTYDMTSSDTKPQVWVMGWENKSSILVADDAAMPQWIP